MFLAHRNATEINIVKHHDVSVARETWKLALYIVNILARSNMQDVGPKKNTMRG